MQILTNYKKQTKQPPQTEIEDPKIKTTKTRGFMSGQKMTSSQMEAEIIRLSKNHTVAEIVKITGKNERTIKRYRQKAKSKGKILTSESGRIQLPAPPAPNSLIFRIYRVVDFDIIPCTKSNYCKS